MSATSILDQMAIDVTKTKKDAAARLTPRGAEKANTPIVSVPDPIPNHDAGILPDDPDLILQRLANARTIIEDLLASVGRLEVLWGKPEQAIAENAAQSERSIAKEKERRADDRAKAEAGDKRAKERIEKERPIAEVEASVAARDADFAAKFAAQQKAAQDATYKDGQVEDPPEPLFRTLPKAWTCEKHGKSVEAISRRGRPYLKCSEDGCEEFEHLV